MTETKFMPGPLAIHHQSQPCTISGFYHVTGSTDRPAYAYVHDRDYALMCAAAPEMFEALQAAMTFIDSHVADPDITQEMADNWARLQAADPHAALSKALGNGGE